MTLWDHKDKEFAQEREKLRALCYGSVSKKIELTCTNCGTKFLRFQSQAVASTHFCSKECVLAHGLIDVPCSWPGCTEKMKGRVFQVTRSDGAKVNSYKVDLRKTGEYKAYHFCPHHKETAARYLETQARPSNGRLKFLADPNCEWDARAISSKFVRMIVFEQSNCRCSACNEKMDWKAPPKTWEVDHIVPVFRGGKTRLNNLQVLCRACHNTKSSAEKSEVARKRHSSDGQRSTRWMTHYEKDQLIASLRAQLDEALRRLK